MKQIVCIKNGKAYYNFFSKNVEKSYKKTKKSKVPFRYGKFSTKFQSQKGSSQEKGCPATLTSLEITVNQYT
jgi:glutamyl/glutaminyl-tRNA synthetase